MPDKKDTEVPVNHVAPETDEISEEEPQELSLSEEELEALCREHVCPKCNVMEQAEDERLRALAETENVKKRLLREADEVRKYAGTAVISDLLPVLDNLDLALNHAQGLEACKDFVVGVEMTRKVFMDILEKHGLALVEAARGADFNPEFHEAVGMSADQALGDNAVAQVVQAGYALKGRVIRPAKVLVNKLS